MRSFHDVLEDARKDFKRNDPYFAPSDEPLSWQMQGVVRLDVAIYAAHLMSARLGFRSFPHQSREAVRGVMKQAAEMLAKQIATKSMSAWMKVWSSIMLIGAQTVIKALDQAATERQIRAVVLRFERMLNRMPMRSKRRRGYKTEYVFTRKP